MNNFHLFLASFLLSSSFIYAQCTTESAIDCECEDANQTSCDLLPDITVSWQWGVGDKDEFPPGEGLQSGEINYPENWFEITPEVEAMGRIRVGARTPNIGSGPLNLRGADKDGYRWMICYDGGVPDTFSVYDPNWNEESYCPDGSLPKHISIQRVYQKNEDGSMGFYEVMVGTMEYHPTHGHMHFNEWTIMSLRVPDPNNMENPLEWEVIGDGAKVGFCVMDLGNCSSENAGCRDDESVYNEGSLLSQGDFPNYGLGGGSYGCSPVSQGISVGYNDTYGSYLDGMFLNIPHCTPNGDYAIVLEVPQVMIESRLDNNYTWFPIALTQQNDFSSLESEVNTTIEDCIDGDIELSTYLNSAEHTYLWSTGENTNSIMINEVGEYSVTIDLCGSGNEVEHTFNVSEFSTVPVLEDVNVSQCPEEIVLEGSMNSSGHTYSWSNGDVGNTTNVDASGEYVLTVDLCGSGTITQQSFFVDFIDIVEPSVSEDTTICEGESVVLNAYSDDNTITWFNENYEVVSSGQEFTTPELYSNAMYYVSAGISQLENVGAEEHSGSQYSSGSDAVGFLAFDALKGFTLNSVEVYTSTPGERKFILMNSDNEVINEHTEFVGFSDEEPYVVSLDFDIEAGSGYLIGTDVNLNIVNFGGENPQLKRSGGNDSELNFPYTIDGTLSLNNSTYFGNGYLNSDGIGDDYTSYYYYLYNWNVTSLLDCHMVPVSIKVDCETNFINEENMNIFVFPNPTEGVVSINLDLESKSDISLALTNSIGQMVYYENLGNLTKLDKSYDWSMLPKGVYTISFNINNQKTFEKIVLQ